MALFEKTLQGIANLDSIMTAANETYRTERKRIMDTYKDPSQKLGEIRRVLTETEAEQKQFFREIVKTEFAAVREKVNKVVTAAPPADFAATLEAIKANGKATTEYEAAAFLAKYKDSNYLAFRTLAEVLHRVDRANDVRIIYPDAIMKEIEEIETLVLNWVTNYKGSSYMTALLLNKTNPITATAAKVEEFLNGKYTLEDAE